MTIAAVPLIANAQLPAALGVLYTCPASTTVIVTHAVFTNTDSSNHTVTIYIVPSGQIAGTSAIVLDTKTVANGASYVSGELIGVVLSPGDTIQGLASAAAFISVYISGFTQT